MLAQTAALRDQAQQIADVLEAGTVTKKQNDDLRAKYKACTRALSLIVIRRRQFERSPDFVRYETLRRLRNAEPDQVLAAVDVADRLTEGVNHLIGKPVKREAPTCGAQALRRPLAACNTLLHSAAPDAKRRRYTPTPHPRAGAEAVRAAGGAVQALIDAPTPRGSSSDESDVEGEAVFSSDEEAGHTSGSD